MVEIAAIVRELVLLDSKLLENRNEQVTQRATVAVVAFKAMMVSMLESTTGKQDWEITTGVGACIPHSAAKQYSRGIQQRSAVAVFGRFQFPEEVGELTGIKTFDDGQLFQ